MPPSYSSVDPRKVSCVNNRNQPTTFPTNVKAPTVCPPRNQNPNLSKSQKYCVLCKQHNVHETVDCPLQRNFQNNPFPAGVPFQNSPPIPPLPHKREVKMNDQKPNETKTNQKNYDQNHNPYVWTNKQATPPQSPLLQEKKTIVIDLNKELPSLNKKIKESSLPSFQHLQSHLRKNISPSEIRKMMVGDKYLSDIKFIVGGSIFHAHKIIMITSSFHFYDHFHIKGESILNVESTIDPETFQKIMNYCYTEKLEVTADNVIELLLAANQLQVRQITNVCHGFISNIMNADSIFTIFEKALELNNEIFKKKCLDFINKNEQKCFSSKGFFAMTLPSLLKTLDACQYSPEKANEIIGKFTKGSMGMLEEPAIPQPPSPKGAVPKKATPGKKKKQLKNASTPSLISHPHTGPPQVSPFPYPPPFSQQIPLPLIMHQSARPFAFQTSTTTNNPYNVLPPMVEKLITVDDDKSAIIVKDDEAKIKINVIGPRQKLQTEISRLDFVCKRSMLIHEIWFSENLAPTCNDILLTMTILEGKKETIIHRRNIPNNKPGKKESNLLFIFRFSSIFIYFRNENELYSFHS